MGWQLNIIDSKQFANPIIFLLIGDNPGPLGNIRCAVSVQMLCLRTSTYPLMRSAHYVHLRDLESRAKCSEYVSGT